MDDSLIRRYRGWMELDGQSPRTIECRTRLLRLLARHVAAQRGQPEPVPLVEITADELNVWQKSLLAPLPSGRLRTVRGRHTYVKYAIEAYHFAQGEGLVGDDRARRLVLPRRLGRRMANPIRTDDLELAIASAWDARLRAWLLLACLAGLRVCEIAAVEREDVHEEMDAPVLLVHGKRAKEQVVPVPRLALLPALRPFLGRRGRIFLRVDGSGPVTPGIVDQTVNAHLHGLGVDSRAHSLRKWYGTWFYELSGHNALLTAEVLGHESVETIATYVRWSQASAAPVVGELARLVAL